MNQSRISMLILLGCMPLFFAGCAEKDEAYVDARTKRLARLYKQPEPSNKIEDNWKSQLAVSEGDVVPNLTGPDCDGRMLQLDEYRGRVILLHYWANW